MTKTIKEMAALAFPTIAEEDKEAIEALKYVGMECDNIHEYNSVRLNQQDLYIMGANAVLECIESLIQPMIKNTKGRIFDIDSDYYNGDVADIYNKIKELKGV